MSDTRCGHCGASTSNGLALCELCQAWGTKNLEFLPIYFRNLARWRPGRAGSSRPVPGSRVLYDGGVRTEDSTGDKIIDAVDDARTMLTTWARAFADDRGDSMERPLTAENAALLGELPEAYDDEHATVARWICQGLAAHMVTIATLEWAGQIVRDLGQHEQQLRVLTETCIPGWYAGACQRQVSLEARCSADTYVVEGLTWVKCQRCGNTTHVSAHLETILEEARAWVGRPKRMAEVIVALLDTEDSVQKLYGRIRWWAHHDQLRPIQHTRREHRYDLKKQDYVLEDVPTGYARYRMGEVLDLITRNTRSSCFISVGC